MREREIEAYFVKRVREAGGLQRKFVSPGVRGVPDRICCFPEGRFALVEMKSPGKMLRFDQAREHDKWIAVGYVPWVIDSKEGVDRFVTWMSR
jgi:hypothetical protein